MGIPCFYSYIVKIMVILLNLSKVPCDNLYIDGNSIIYTHITLELRDNFEQTLIQEIIINLMH